MNISHTCSSVLLGRYRPILARKVSGAMIQKPGRLVRPVPIWWLRLRVLIIIRWYANMWNESGI